MFHVPAVRCSETVTTVGSPAGGAAGGVVAVKALVGALREHAWRRRSAGAGAHGGGSMTGRGSGCRARRRSGPVGTGPSSAVRWRDRLLRLLRPGPHHPGPATQGRRIAVGSRVRRRCARTSPASGGSTVRPAPPRRGAGRGRHGHGSRIRLILHPGDRDLRLPAAAADAIAPMMDRRRPSRTVGDLAASLGTEPARRSSTSCSGKECWRQPTVPRVSRAATRRGGPRGRGRPWWTPRARPARTSPGRVRGTASRCAR